MGTTTLGMGIGGSQSSVRTAKKTEGQQSLSSLKMKVAELVRDDGFDCPRPPDIAMKVLRLCNRPDTGIPEIARVVELDPFIAGQLLSIANSPVYRGSCEITSIQRALSQVGLKTSRDLVFAIAMRGRIFRNEKFAPHMKRLWEHSAGCGRVCEFVADWTGFKGEYAFLAGLLHDVGKPVVLSVVSDLTRRGDSSLSEVDDIDALLSELHVEVGSLIAGRWELPSEITDAIRWHHEPGNAQEAADLAQLVNAANTLCHHFGIGCLAEQVEVAQIDSLRALGMGSELIEELARDVGNKTLEPDFLPF